MRQATDRAFTLIGDGRYEDAGALLDARGGSGALALGVLVQSGAAPQVPARLEQARAAGLRAVALLDRESGAPDWWNVGIAATALQDWPLARRAWQAYGLKVPGSGLNSAATTEPTGMELGSAAVRLSPEGEAEVVWGAGLTRPGWRCSPSRCRPPGWRWGEVVLHDGVPHGERTTAAGHTYPVFDEIELWALLLVPTWVVLLEAATESDRDALEQLAADAGFAADCFFGAFRRRRRPQLHGCRPTRATVISRSARSQRAGHPGPWLGIGRTGSCGFPSGSVGWLCRAPPGSGRWTG
ncbi:Tetratricopeptide repeat domain-containing protein OS=Streptomyces violarus OX=67380 GN=FHS41_002332 PE=4 SV=1 [Streptomyces violarus]